MPNEPRLQVLDLPLTIVETQYRAAQEATPRTVTVTTMNASAGTVTSTQFGATSTHVGCFLIPEDGAIRGQARQVVSYVVSTNVATLDAGWTSSTGVTTMRSWMPAEVPCRSTATGTTTSFTSSPHGSITNEPDDFFNDAFIMYRTPGSNFGGFFKVNDFTSSGGVFDMTGDAFVAAPADGDLGLLRHLARPEGPINVTIDRKVVERQMVGFRAGDQNVPITAEGSLEFMAALRPLTASAGSTVQATAPTEMGRYLRDFMTETKDTGSTVSSASAGSVTTAAGTQSVGGFILCANGEASQIEAVSGQVLTVPHIVTTPATSSTVYASAWYKMKQNTFFTRTWDVWRGRLFRQYLAGCAPAVELQITRDQVVKFSMKYTAGEAIAYNTVSPDSLTSHQCRILDTTVPVDGKGARVYLNGVKVLVGDIKIAFGLKPTLRPCLSGMNQYDGVFFDFDTTKVTMTGVLADNDDTSGATDLYDQMETGQPVRFFYQKGSNPKETFCIAIPALNLSKCTFGMENNEGAFSIEGTAILPQAVRGGSFGSTVPDMSLGWL